MRIVKGNIAQVFHIHKMWGEFLSDIGEEVGQNPDDMDRWLPKFGTPKFFCIMAIHGKKWVGMSWGYLPGEDKKLLLEGIFVKKGFRGKIKPVRLLTKALVEISTKTGAVAVSSIVPENCTKRLRRKGFKVSRVILEKAL